METKDRIDSTKILMMEKEGDVCHVSQDEFEGYS